MPNVYLITPPPPPTSPPRKKITFNNFSFNFNNFNILKELRPKELKFSK